MKDIKELKLDKSNWRLVKLGDVVSEVRKTTKDPVEDGLENVVGLEHITPEDIHLRNAEHISSETTFTKTFEKGDVLFGRRRVYLKKAAQAPFSGICSGDITVMRVKKELREDLLPFIINNDLFFDFAVKHSAGGLSPRVKWKDLANYEFLLPPKEEQARLAELLWSLDEVIEREREVLEKIEWVKNIQLSIIFDKNNCSKTTLGAISVNLDNKRKPVTKKDRLPGDTPYYGASGIVDYVNGYTHNESILLISEDGENLQSRKLPIAYEVDGKCWINNHAHALKITGYSRFLVKEYFNFSEISDFIAGGTRPKLTKGTLTNMPIFLPSEKSKEICERKLLNLDKSKVLVFDKCEKSKSLQKSLINEIFG